MAGIHKLTEKKLKGLPANKVVSDGGNLYVQANASGTVSFSFRKMINGKNSIIGLGSYPGVSLEQAREKAGKIREHVRAGGDPTDAMREEIVLSKPDGPPTFWEYADAWLKRHKPIVPGAPKTNHLWRQRITDHAQPIHKYPMDKVTMKMIADKVLMPIWFTNAETAKRLQNHLFRIFASARVEGMIQVNPADWVGNLDAYMPKQNHKVTHSKALAIEELPAFYSWMEAKDTLAAIAWQMVVLTGLRSSEAREARWSEFDLEQRVWTVPAERMKKPENGDHRIPITDALISLLDRAIQFSRHGRSAGLMPRDLAKEIEGRAKSRMKGDNFVFYSGSARNLMVSETAMRNLLDKSPWAKGTTIQGLRRPFRTWLETKGGASHNAAERALHHKERDKTVRTYIITDYLDERREPMARWSEYITGAAGTGKVVPMVAGAA